MSSPNIPGIVFMRGGAVTILVIITSDSGMRYSILVVQPRVAIGKYSMAELPAGMIDNDDSFGGAAAKELEEETGLKINASDLEDLTEDMGYAHAYPSCGGCDEFMKFYLFSCKMGKKKLESFQSKCTGAFEEGENIKLKIVPFDRLAEHSPDMKTLSALYLYEQRCRRRATMYSTYGGGRIIGQSTPNDAKMNVIPDDPEP
jgi:ADP-sugar diphosphatase